MPQIRKITVPLAGHEIDEPVLETAFAVAKRFEANLRAADVELSDEILAEIQAVHKG